jgi:hypothetical protein
MAPACVSFTPVPAQQHTHALVRRRVGVPVSRQPQGYSSTIRARHLIYACTSACVMMMILLLFLQKQNLASALYLFGLGTRLSDMRASAWAKLTPFTFCGLAVGGFIYFGCCMLPCIGGTLVAGERLHLSAKPRNLFARLDTPCVGSKCAEPRPVHGLLPRWQKPQHREPVLCSCSQKGRCADGQ